MPNGPLVQIDGIGLVQSRTYAPFKPEEFSKSAGYTYAHEVTPGSTWGNAPVETIGTLNVVAPGTGATGNAINLTSNFSGNASGETYQWSVTTANSADATFSAATASATTITCASAGSYGIQLVVTDANATDSPKTATATLVIA